MSDTMREIKRIAKPTKFIPQGMGSIDAEDEEIVNPKTERRRQVEADYRRQDDERRAREERERLERERLQREFDQRNRRYAAATTRATNPWNTEDYTNNYYND